MCGEKILDDLDRIKSLDRSAMIEHCLRMAEYCVDSINLSRRLAQDVGSRIQNWGEEVNSIVIAGMGGSAIGGDLLKGWVKEEIDVPIEICRDYHLPKYADEETLVFTISYSGNTEETLSVFLDSVRRGCKVIAVTSGGYLSKFADKVGIPLVKIPQGMPPRAALPYLFFPQAVALEELGLIGSREEEMEETISILESLKDELKPEVSTEINESKKLAYDILGKIPLIVGYGFLKAVVDRFRTQFNENSKLLGISNSFPELNHNLIMSWELDDQITRMVTVILLRSPLESEQVKSRIDVTRSLVFSKASKVIELTSRGRGKLANMFSTIFVGDMASVYLAILRGVDPTPVATIERLKSEVKERLHSIKTLETEFSKLSRRIS